MFQDMSYTGRVHGDSAQRYKEYIFRVVTGQMIMNSASCLMLIFFNDQIQRRKLLAALMDESGVGSGF